MLSVVALGTLQYSRQFSSNQIAFLGATLLIPTLRTSRMKTSAKQTFFVEAYRFVFVVGKSSSCVMGLVVTALFLSYIVSLPQL